MLNSLNELKKLSEESGSTSLHMYEDVKLRGEEESNLILLMREGKIKRYLVSRMSRTREMIEAFDNAILNTFPDLNASGLIIRSDNGSQLTSQGYEKHLRTLGIKHETIHAHTP